MSVNLSYSGGTGSSFYVNSRKITQNSRKITQNYAKLREITQYDVKSR